MAYLTAGCRKPLADASVEVYFDLLKDLDEQVMFAAVRRVLCDHVWATFPSIAELRAAATEAMAGKALTAGEAWQIAWQCVGRNYDPEIHGEYRHGGKVYPSQLACLTEGLPPQVLEAINAYGAQSLACGAEPLGVVRAQFMKIFEAVEKRERREAVLPESVKRDVAAIADKQAHPAVEDARAKVFKAIDG